MAEILVGAVYGLMSVGLGIIFGVMRVINFAQGEFRAARFQFGASIRSSSGKR
jgi:branched-subunit amino acid ABC-type transport system permease component